MFSVAKILGGRQNVPETLELPVTAGTAYSVGEALVLTSGKLTAASGDVDVKYISLENYTAPDSGARRLKCFRVLPDMLFEVPLSAYAATVVPGAKVTIGSGGLTVTATAVTDAFGAEIVDANGAAAKDDTVFVVLR